MVRRSSERTCCSPGISSCSATVCHGTKRADVACCGFLGRLLVGRDVSLFIMAHTTDPHECWKALGTAAQPHCTAEHKQSWRPPDSYSASPNAPCCIFEWVMVEALVFSACTHPHVSAFLSRMGIARMQLDSMLPPVSMKDSVPVVTLQPP